MDRDVFIPERGVVMMGIKIRRGVPLVMITEGFVWIRDGYDDRLRF